MSKNVKLCLPSSIRNLFSCKTTKGRKIPPFSRKENNNNKNSASSLQTVQVKVPVKGNEQYPLLIACRLGRNSYSIIAKNHNKSVFKTLESCFYRLFFTIIVFTASAEDWLPALSKYSSMQEELSCPKPLSFRLGADNRNSPLEC